MIDAMQWFQLNGKKAMVTGGAAGLCYAMAEGLHLAGAEVVLVDRSPAVGEAAARLGAQGAPVHGVQGDLSHWEGIPALYDRALAALGGRGVNVNAIAPGYMVTQLTADMQGKNPAQYAEITGRIPMHRWGQRRTSRGRWSSWPARRRRHPAGGRRLPGEVRIHRNFRAIPLIYAKKE